jgi:protein-S-isoprenylcysteine O-methyltransferase Ste14
MIPQIVTAILLSIPLIIMLILNIVFAGKNLCPAQSGIIEGNKLIQNGPFGIIRHPLYVSYILILSGLSLIPLIYWLLIPTLLIIIGIYPIVKSEEKNLTEQFGEEYIEYKRKAGMLFPKLKRGWRK